MFGFDSYWWMDCQQRNMTCIMWIVFVVLFEVIQSTNGSDDIPTYFIHERCGQSINLRRESVFMAKIELLPGIATSGLVEINSNKNLRGHYVNQPVPCVFNIESWSFQNRLMVNFEEMSSVAQIGCSKPVLEIFDGPSEQYPRITGLTNLACRSVDNDPMSMSLATTDIHLTLRYHGNSTSRFRASIVAFHEGQCRSYEHQCRNGRCIMSELMCNGHNPCGDFSDCPSTIPPEPEIDVSNHDNMIIVAMVSTGATLLVMIICGIVLYKCYQLRKKHRRLHRHHEDIVAEQTQLHSPRYVPRTTSQPVYQRTVSQIEAERRFAPPSYSQLPVIEAETEVESSDSDDVESPRNDRRIEILPLQECLSNNENNPPSYACVMLHQDEFHVSELNISELLNDSPETGSHHLNETGSQHYSGDNESSADET